MSNGTHAYFLKGTWENHYAEVDKDTYLKVERAAGFNNVANPDEHATERFSNGMVSGKVYAFGQVAPAAA